MFATSISELYQHYSAQDYIKLYEVSETDQKRIRYCGELVQASNHAFIEKWYEWLRELPEFDHFFADQQVLERVQNLQYNYWESFFSAIIDDQYVELRRRIGTTHARIGLPLNTYFAGMHHFLMLFQRWFRTSNIPQEEYMDYTESVAKILHLDTAVVVETYNALIEESLTSQSRMLMEMSTPVTQIWPGILLLPIVGIIDSKRAGDVMTATLEKISDTQARVFIIDISGVAVVDTAVANHLIKITQATRLMGCACTISGISPSIAQTIVDLGIDVGKVKTTATLNDALADAFSRVETEIPSR